MPFSTAPIINPEEVSLPTPPVSPMLALAHPSLKQSEDSLNKGNEFLSELRDFMNEFAADDLNIDSIEEPSAMTKEQANFYIKMYQQVIAEEKEMNDICDSEIDRMKRAINAYRDTKSAEINKRKAYFESILKQFAASELDGKKVRTIKLPYGNLSFKKQQPKYDYLDMETTIKCLETIKPELINEKVTYTVDKANLKKEAEIVDGNLYIGQQLVEGVTVTKQDDKFEIK